MKIMILGASYPCKDMSCPIREECSKCDFDYKERLCHTWEADNIKVSDCVKTEIAEYRDFPKSDSAYFKFMDPFCKYVNSKGFVCQQDELWDYIAFMEYIQHTVIKSDYTSQGEVRPTDFDMFIHEVNRISPDLILVWGAPARDNILGNIYDYFDVNDIEPRKLIRVSLNSHDIFIVFMDHPTKPGGCDYNYTWSLIDEVLELR